MTFALHTVLLREHNRCCAEKAPGLDFSGDEVRDASELKLYAVYTYMSLSSNEGSWGLLP